MMTATRMSRIVLTVWLYCIICAMTSFGNETQELELEREANEIEEDVEYPYNNEITTTSPNQTKTKVTGSSSPKTAPRSDHVRHVDEVDKYLIDGILNIIDERFETLNKRIMTLERNMNTLQYYNFRSFRVVNTHLHSLDTVIHNTNGHLDQISKQNKVMEENIAAVNKEVIDLQSLNSGMFQAIEQNLVYFHQDIQSRFTEVKDGVDQTNKRLSEVKNDTTSISSDVNDMQARQSELQQIAESSVVLSSNVLQSTSSLDEISRSILKISENLEMKYDNQHSSIDGMLKNMSLVTENTGDIKYTISSFLSNVSVNPPISDIGNEDTTVPFPEFKPSNLASKTSCSKILDVLEEKLKQLSVNVSCANSQRPNLDIPHAYPTDFVNQSQKLIKALSTINDNIYQSVTLYRHTGNLIERVIADTELIGNEQVRLREDIIEFLTNGTIDLFNQSLPQFTEFIELKKKTSATTESESKTDVGCHLSKSVTDDLVKLTQNGSQLLELLTELATTSTASLKQGLQQIDKAVNRLDKGNGDATNVPVRDDPRAGTNQYLKDIHNRTEWIFLLVEAIASNTGWIPYVFHNTKFVESQVNKTLKLTKDIDLRTQEMNVRQRANMAIMFKPTNDKLRGPIVTHGSPTAEHETEDRTIDPAQQDSSHLDKPEIDQRCVPVNESSVYSEMMEFIYMTNTKLNRLMPALTVFLGEPERLPAVNKQEPYISLLNGSNEREGRVEIYHKGVWGTIAGALSHIEAAYICRKLGYLGGISAGNGVYGSGSGVFWKLNVTCLRTRWCDAVTYVTTSDIFDHTNDVGVICDHMLRISPDSDDDDNSRHSGRLEIYHENQWYPICNEGWSREDTSVACRQLGFVEGASHAVKNETFVDIKWMKNVKCTGSENSLDACAYEGFRWNECADLAYVFIVCS